MDKLYTVIIKSSDMEVCRFTTTSYTEALEIEKSANKFGYDTEWRIKNDL